MELWNKVKRPPESALKTIVGGRLKGMTDIKPQWRYQAMTEIFGPCGTGWSFEIVRLWSETSPDGSIMAFAHIHLFYKLDGQMNCVPGVGGSGLVQKEKDGLRANDEAYKMAVTDAVSTAMKMLGVAADVHFGQWDGSKYKDEPKEIKKAEVDKESSDKIYACKSIPELQAVFEALTPEQRAGVKAAKDEMKVKLNEQH